MKINTCGRFDFGGHTWTILSPMPKGVNHAACGTDGSRLYVFGGRGGGNVPSVGYDTVQVFSPPANNDKSYGGTWISSDTSPAYLPSLPVQRGGMGAAVLINNEFYVIGGETTDGNAGNSGAYDRVDVFSLSTGGWRFGGYIPIGMHGIYPVALLDSRIVIAGGGVTVGASASNNVFISDTVLPPTTTVRTTTSSTTAPSCAKRPCTYNSDLSCEKNTKWFILLPCLKKKKKDEVFKCKAKIALSLFLQVNVTTRAGNMATAVSI